MADYYDNYKIDFSYYWTLLKVVFKKSYKRALLMGLFVGVIAFLYTRTLAPQYRATTIMHVEPKSQAVFNLRELLSNRRDPAFRETQVGIIRSRALLSKVVEKEELFKRPEFSVKSPSVIDKLMEKFSSGQSDKVQVDPVRLATDSLIEKITVTADRRSYLMRISLDFPDAELGATITNSLAEQYVRSVEVTQRTSTESSEKWLLDRLEVVSQDLQQAELALQEFKERENILGSSERNDGLVSQEVDMISNRLLEAKQKRLGIEALYQQVVSAEQGRGDIQGINAIKNDSIVQNIRGELVDLESRQGELAQRYGPEHRRMIELASQIRATEDNLLRQIRRVAAAIKSDYELAKESESFLQNSLANSTSKVQTLGRKQFELLGLEQNVQTQRKVYQAFLKRLNENRGTGVSINENVRITDPALPALKPLPSKGTVFIVLLSLLTAAFGFLIGLINELFNSTISTDQDVSKSLNTTSLGSVPMIEDVGDDLQKNVAYQYFGNNKVSQFSESVRTVRSSLMLSSIDEQKRRILVTSTVPGEGKTSMAISLAMAFGQVQKTLLIDCDLRRPSLDELIEKNKFGRRRAGFNDLCLGTATASECIHSASSRGFDLITAGTVNPNPQELFCSSKFTDVLNRLGEVYDVIILDSPPSGGLSDSMLISTQVDQIAYVIKANTTPVTKIRATLQSLAKFGAPLSGAIVNQVPMSDSSFSYYYGRGYYADSVQAESNSA